MCSLRTPDVIDTISNEHGCDSGVDADPAVEPNVIPAEDENVCRFFFSRCYSHTVFIFNRSCHSFILPQHPSLTSQVDMSDSMSIATVVKFTSDHTTDDMSSLPPSAESITHRPKPINLDDIPLNSPSSQIVGTPFANDNTRFEYPFPDSNQNCSSGSSPAASDLSGSAPSSSSSTSFPTLSTSSQVLTQLSFPPPSHHPSYNTTHPKLKVQANPPIPPNLVKRRLRWSLKLLGRRRSSTGSQLSATSDESTMTNGTDGQQPASPSESPTQERVKR